MKRMLQYLKDLSVGSKLTAIIMTTSISSLLLACVIFIVWQQFISRRNLVSDISTKAEIIACGSRAPLGFGVPEDAAKVLTSLQADPIIEGACIISKSGSLFAGTHDGGIEWALRLMANEGGQGYYFDSSYLYLTREIIVDGKAEGNVCLKVSLSQMCSLLRFDTIIVLFVMGLCIPIAYLVSSRLTHVVTAPINDLCRMATIVTWNNDYALRASKSSNDEIGMLADSFNEMLGQVQERDMSLVEAMEDLKSTARAFKETRDELELIFRNMPSAVFTVDTEQRVTNWLPGTEMMTGIKTEDALGRKCTEIWDCPACLHTCELFSKGVPKPIQGKEFTVTINDRKMNILKNADVITDNEGNVVGGIEIFEDITSRKEAEAKLEKLNNELEHTVRKLRDSNQALAEFAYVASHDLREPLRKISSFGHLLQDSLNDKLGHEDKENLDFMVDGAVRLQQMIEALLMYSRITTKATEFGEVDLAAHVEGLKEFELCVQISDTGASVLAPEPLPKVKGCDPQIHQLMQNLIANALKYRRKDVAPEVVIAARRLDNNMVRIEVQDNGIGIAPNYREQVFGMFRRLHNKDEYEGCGIGLAVCKKIVERHGGQIGIDGNDNGGSIFWFTLPLAESPCSSPPDSSNVPSEAQTA